MTKFLKSEEKDYLYLIKKTFSRGKLELSIDVFNWSEKKASIFDKKLLKNYYKELNKIKTDLKLSSEIPIGSLLSLDGIIKRERVALSSSSLKEIKETIKIVLKKTHDMREKEGGSTKKDIEDSLSFVAKSVVKIKKLSKDVVIQKKKTLLEKIEKLSVGKVDHPRVMTEVALLVDKLDINEEIVRLNDHIKKFKEIIKESGQIGRKLDFLGQELFREINTIASKSANSEIAHIAVDVKNHIDKIREQCRNIV